MKHLRLFFLFLCVSLSAQAQKVGLVFSGGGAKGLAHVGVLKALEENNVPRAEIDEVIFILNSMKGDVVTK